MRFDLYGLIHKAQRKYLFELSVAIGKANPADEMQCKNIASRITDMIAHIEEHSYHEESFIHPLYAEIGRQDVLLNEAHHQIHEQFELLKQLSTNREMEKLYAEFNRFVANYLLHTDEEERLQAEILWKHFDDQRLMGVIAQFSANKPEEFTRTALEFMAPALNIQELMKLFSS